MASIIKIEIDEATLKKLVIEFLKELLGEVDCKEENVMIETKSTQNYKAEWEKARFRASFETKLP